jgi:hypothetical protein
MNSDSVERLANAVLYEGYMLYPYRPSAVKNRRRFNFGVLVPPSYAATQNGTESSVMRGECLVRGTAQTSIDLRLRYLHVLPGDWQQAEEQELDLSGWAASGSATAQAHFPLAADLTLGFESVPHGLLKVTAEARNHTDLDRPEQHSRDEVLPYSLVAAHMILRVHDGEFVSLLDPPDDLRESAAQCRNQGCWPILAGEPGSHDAMLASPIILYDYAQVAPESPGDLFDGAEIDEILTLRILTLTDEEKQEIRNGDERARRILERSEGLPEEHLLKLHGVLRGMRPVEEPK